MRVETKEWKEWRYHIGDYTDGGCDYRYRVTCSQDWVHPESPEEKGQLFQILLNAKIETTDFLEHFNASLNAMFAEYTSKKLAPRRLAERATYEALPWYKRLSLNIFEEAPPVYVPPRNYSIPKKISEQLQLLRLIANMSSDVKLFYTPLKREVYEALINYETVINELNSYLTIDDIVVSGCYSDYNRLVLAPKGFSSHIWNCVDIKGPKP